jgi:hypothetical protein
MKATILPDILYGHETLSVFQRKGHESRVFEKREYLDLTGKLGGHDRRAERNA